MGGNLLKFGGMGDSHHAGVLFRHQISALNLSLLDVFQVAAERLVTPGAELGSTHDFESILLGLALCRTAHIVDGVEHLPLPLNDRVNQADSGWIRFNLYIFHGFTSLKSSSVINSLIAAE